MIRTLSALRRATVAAWVLVPIYLEYLVLFVVRLAFGWSLSEARLERLHRRNADRFFRLAARLQAGMIKAGQAISTRVDIVPSPWVERLSLLQDRVPATPWPTIEAHLRGAYGESPELRFREIDPTPVAAASFGQVHRAIAHDGRELALKVQYPGLRDRVETDLFIFRIATPLFNVFVPKVRLGAVYREVAAALRSELDYEREAEMSGRIRENLASLPGVVVPAVVPEHGTPTVLATEFYHGQKVTDREALVAAGIEPKAVLELVLAAWVKMVYVDGLFQSDPHPGNLLVGIRDGKPELCILDFGQVKELPADFHEQLFGAAAAFMTKNTRELARSLVDLGMLDAQDAAAAGPFIEQFFQRYFHLTPAEARSLDIQQIRREVRELLRRIQGVTIPQDLVLHHRAVALIEGIAAALDDSQNLLVLAQPHLLRAVAQRQARTRSLAGPGSAKRTPVSPFPVAG